jgi:hypothetical protein
MLAKSDPNPFFSPGVAKSFQELRVLPMKRRFVQSSAIAKARMLESALCGAPRHHIPSR